jgi:hypothetical protein
MHKKLGYGVGEVFKRGSKSGFKNWNLLETKLQVNIICKEVYVLRKYRLCLHTVSVKWVVLEYVIR